MFFDGVEECISDLSKKYLLGILTNGNADIYKFKIGKYFKFSISSLEARDSKPNRSHFDMALAQVNDVTFENMLHIGDHQINDMYAADNLGIDCLWFNNNHDEWEQNFEKPDEFSSWQNLTNIIKDKYER